MLRPRIIPCLLINNCDLVNTKKFYFDKYIGDPINTLRIFNDKEVDEIIFLDINATKSKIGPNYDLLKDIASECFMPVTYGGGITTLNQIEKVLKLGFEKISINGRTNKNISFLYEAVKEFGSSTIIASINIKTHNRSYKVYDYINNRLLDDDMFVFLNLIENTGIGEIFVTDVDREGTLMGYNFDLINKLNNKFKIPIIFNGGANSYIDLKDAIKNDISAVSASSLFVYYGRLNAVLISYPSPIEQNVILNERNKL
jgi:cyclase